MNDLLFFGDDDDAAREGYSVADLKLLWFLAGVIFAAFNITPRAPGNCLVIAIIKKFILHLVIFIISLISEALSISINRLFRQKLIF